MSLKDKLELGLKPDAAYRPDNLPEHQQDDPACAVAGQPGESATVESARDACDNTTSDTVSTGQTTDRRTSTPPESRPRRQRQ
jgi:hypothetical protein